MTRQPIAVNLARSHTANEHMPIVIGAVFVWIEVDDPRGLTIIRRIKEQELSCGAVLGKDAEIGAVIGQRSTQGKAATPPVRRFRWGIGCMLRQVPQHKFAVPAIKGSPA
jgi:hypothetical protein